jgi:hypothetical protein
MTKKEFMQAMEYLAYDYVHNGMNILLENTPYEYSDGKIYDIKHQEIWWSSDDYTYIENIEDAIQDICNIIEKRDELKERIAQRLAKYVDFKEEDNKLCIFFKKISIFLRIKKMNREVRNKINLRSI